MVVGSFVKTRPSARDRGFTLVELLATMAVIAILAAILFPVLIKVKEAAKISDCLANMRQLGAGLHMYLDENDLRFPAAVPWGAPDYWHKNSQKTFQECVRPYVRNGMLPDGNGLYAKSGVFVCPSDAGIPRQFGDSHYGVPANQPLWKYTGCSYEYYASNQDDDEADVMPKVSGDSRIEWTGLSPEIVGSKGVQRVGAPYRAVMYPTKKAVLGDTWLWHMGDTIPVDRLLYRNTLFADGHAARLPGGEHVDARQIKLAPWHTYREIEE